MPGEPVPTNPLATIFENVNLPKIIAGPAGEAVSKLVGGVVDIPAAWLNQFAQGIRDKTEAKTAVSKAVAAEAAKLVSSDPDIVNRAAQSFLMKELRHQAAKESIAKKTIEILEEEAKATPQGSPPLPEHPIDDDWMNTFARYAEEASTERMQRLWARVLAGQIRAPGGYSLQTLRFVSELDQRTAALFEKYASRVILDFIPSPPRSGDEFDELLSLSEIGLTSSPADQLIKIYSLSVPGLFMTLQNVPAGPLLRLACDKEISLEFPAILLTRVGREVLQMIKPTLSMETVKDFVGNLPKIDGLQEIAYFDPRDPSRLEVLWKREVATPGLQSNQSPQ